MSRFKIKLKLQGFELDVEGSREDLPAISQNIANQLTALIAPAAALVDGGKPLTKQAEKVVDAEVVVGAGKRTKRKKNSAAPIGSRSEGAEQTVSFKHDPNSWGSPLQGWTTLDKSIWLVYVIEKQGGKKELTQPQITNTFNAQFRQAGALKPSNVSRDLGKAKLAKSGEPALVGQDSTQSPAPYYLTAAGYKRAEELVTAARGG